MRLKGYKKYGFNPCFYWMSEGTGLANHIHSKRNKFQSLFLLDERRYFYTGGKFNIGYSRQFQSLFLLDERRYLPEVPPKQEPEKVSILVFI